MAICPHSPIPLEITKATRAVTIHGPWAWAVAHGYKRVENRVWETPFRGELVIHAGKSRDSDTAALAAFKRLKIEPPESFPRSCLVATVELTQVLTLEEYLEQYGDDPMNREFACGPFCWVLTNPCPRIHVPCPGNFQIWNVMRQLKRVKRK